ncbi:MAG: heavy metal translocating P-type ATPase [Thermoplasmata archaeon]|nr:heavy metal translocating P-type ATPase [Thermoplasmata archaeon]
MATDPICGMYVDEVGASLKLTRGTRTYYFCASSCLEQFAAPGLHQSRLRRELLVAWPLAATIALLTYLEFPFSGSTLIAAGLASIVQFYPGLAFYRGTLDALRARMGNMDVLIAVGTSAAYLYSVAVVLEPGRLPPALYFDASSLIIALILTGNYLEQRTRDRAGATLRRLGELLPRIAHRWDGRTESEVPVDALRAGDIIRVRAGERFPADGAIHSGHSSSNESLLTGEPLPVQKGPADRVLAGSLNGDGLLEVEVTQVGPDTLVAQVGQLVAEAETSRVPLQRLADRIAAAFVPAVLLLSVIAASLWAVFGRATPTEALLIFVTVVIIACPCAFGIATPAAVVVGTGRAADAGILYKGHDAIERAARIDLVLTDKTGTLTRGRPTLVRTVTGTELTEATALAWAAGLEAGSTHPFAEAVRGEAAGRGIAPVRVTGATNEPGRGVSGTIDGQTTSLWGLDAALAAHVSLDRWSDRWATPQDASVSWSVLVREGNALGLLGFADEVAPAAAAAVAALREDGIEVEMVTGDRESTARAVASSVGIRIIHARASPAEKLRILRMRQGEGHRVAFVGDGINDAAALTAADVGIAIGAGAEVAKEAGQILLLRTEFEGVPLALRVARGTVGKVRQNLRWAIGYNAFLLPVAAGVLVPFLGFGVYAELPILGAVAMALSSTTVVLNSLSLRWISLPGGRRATPSG